jgi:hypothetical protein
MANYLSALSRCLVLLTFLIFSGIPLKAQIPIDAFVTTSDPVNDIVMGTMFVTLADTNQVEFIEIKLGSNEGVFNLFDYSFVYDQTTSLPTGCTWNRVGTKLNLALGEFDYSDVQFGSVRVKSNGVWSDAFAFVTN